MAPALRQLYRGKRDVMERALRERLGGRLTWPEPKGGFFLWATLPEGVDDQTLLDRALAQRLVFVIGSAFYVDGSGHDRIRLSFSAPSAGQIQEGVVRLAAVMDSAREAVGGPAAPSMA
jgi:DNA-binding transcriptional MocR family regulator